MAELDTAAMMSKILELSDRLDRIEGQQQNQPLYQLAPMEADSRVLPAENVELVSASQTSGATKAAIRWVRPADPNIDRFEVWVKRTSYDSDSPTLVASVQDSPACFTVTADKSTAAVAYIRTIMKSGLGTDLNASPTVTFNVDVPTSAPTAGSVGDSSLDRVSADKVQIVNADVVDVGFAKITDVLITNAMIDSLAVSKITGWSGASISLGAGLTWTGTGTFIITADNGISVLADIVGYGDIVMQGGGNLISSSRFSCGSSTGDGYYVGTIIIDKDRNMTPANVDVSGAYKVGGNVIVSSTRIANFVSLNIGGTEVISSTRVIGSKTASRMVPRFFNQDDPPAYTDLSDGEVAFWWHSGVGGDGMHLIYRESTNLFYSAPLTAF